MLPAAAPAPFSRKRSGELRAWEFAVEVARLLSRLGRKLSPHRGGTSDGAIQQYFHGQFFQFSARICMIALHPCGRRTQCKGANKRTIHQSHRKYRAPGVCQHRRDPDSSLPGCRAHQIEIRAPAKPPKATKTHEGLGGGWRRTREHRPFAAAAQGSRAGAFGQMPIAMHKTSLMGTRSVAARCSQQVKEIRR